MACYSFYKRLLALMVGGLLCLQAQSAVISAVATDVADTTPTEDLWQLRYQLVGALPASLFLIPLDFNVYGNPTVVQPVAVPLIADVAPGGPNLDAFMSLVVDTALAAGETAGFDLLFTRLAGPPFGPQAYELYDVLGNFIEIGNVDVTVGATPVPEPGTWALMGLGVALLGSTKSRRSRATPTASPT